MFLLPKNVVSTIICLTLLLPVYVHAKDSAIVIFDGSGSMKAKVADKSKISIARDVMGSLMQDWNEEIDLGLMVYGHRSKACDDIEIVVPVGKPNPTAILDAINSITPKGETPIGASLKMAAEKLNYIESPTTVILVSDGEESCKSDPCAVAKELEKAGVNFTAHVIGYDVSDEKMAKAQEQLKCVAESTGGKFFEAENSEGLKTALAETAKAVAEPEKKPAEEVVESGDVWIDDFEREELGDAYNVKDPDEERLIVSDGQLLIVTTDPVKNIVIRKEPVSGDFEASVKLQMKLSEHNDVEMKYIAGKDQLKLGYFTTRYTDDAYIYFSKSIKGKDNTIKYTGKLGKRDVKKWSKEQEDWFFKIAKKGFKYTAFASADGNKWTKVGEHTLLKKQGQIALSAWGKGVEDPVLFDDLTIKAITIR
jgi:hypothetical protein